MSEKKALCIRSREELKQLATGETTEITAFMVPRTICETVSDVRPYIQLIPYVNFTAMNPQDGQLYFLTYERPETGGEERLHRNKSVGFGGHIDDFTDVVGEQLGNAEAYEGFSYPAVKMDRRQLVQTMFNTAVREVKEEIGIDLTEMGLTYENIQITLVQDENPGDVEKVHECVSIPIDLTPQSLVELKEKLAADEREILNVNIVGIDLNEQYTHGEPAFEALANLLKQEQNFERWSVLVIMERIKALMNFVKNYTTFRDVFKAAELNFAHVLDAQRKAVEAERAAAEAPADAEVVTDAQVVDASPSSSEPQAV